MKTDGGVHPALAELRLLTEILRRRDCRRSFAAWCDHALAARGQRPAAHHRLMIRELQAVADGTVSRLMLFFPRGAAKSTYLKLFTAWWLARTQDGPQIVCASHTQSLSNSISGDVQRFVRENSEVLGYGLAGEARDDWRTTAGGRYRATGVSGAIAGARAMLASIDDPVRDAEAADSETQREAVWEWYWGDLMGCLTPGAPVVIIMTRWHEDDLAGRLLATQPGAWRVVKVPAIAGANDPLGRAPGEWLWADDDYGFAEELKRKKAAFEASGATRVWSAQYQQEPRPPEGSLFRVPKIGVLEAEPAGGDVCRAWDLAATVPKGSADPDWTAGVKLQRAPSGQFIVLHVVRVRGGPDEVDAAIVNTAHADGKSVRIGLPQDPGQAGKTQVLYLTRRLQGFRVESSPETGDKATRAGPVASQCNVGNLSVVKATWNTPFLAELRDFPVGTKDDQVDALSRAFSMVGMNRGPIAISPELLVASRRRG